MHIDKKELAAARSRRVQRSARRTTAAPVLSGRRITIFALMLLILVVLGFVIDGQRLKKMGALGPGGGITVKQDLQNLVLGQTQKPFVDERGRFSIVAPAGWRRLDRADTGEYDVIWTGPLQTDFRIQVAKKSYTDFKRLRREIEQIERSFGGTQHIQDIKIAGLPAVQRHGKLQESSFLAVDFMSGQNAFHVLCSVPKEQLEVYEPVLMDLISTLHPTP